MVLSAHTARRASAGASSCLICTRSSADALESGVTLISFKRPSSPSDAILGPSESGKGWLGSPWTCTSIRVVQTGRPSTSVSPASSTIHEVGALPPLHISMAPMPRKLKAFLAWLNRLFHVEGNVQKVYPKRRVAVSDVRLRCSLEELCAGINSL